MSFLESPTFTKMRSGILKQVRNLWKDKAKRKMIERWYECRGIRINDKWRRKSFGKTGF